MIWRKIKLDLYLTPHTRMDFRWIKDLNMRAKLLTEENIHLSDLRKEKDFFKCPDHK